MTIKIEEILVGCDPLLAEAKATLPLLKPGQSFVIPLKYASPMRNHIKVVPGKFKTLTLDEGMIRIGRVT